ncbi:MAG: CHC2 zinc finger domain-containing protein [Nitrosomonadaceae bacterium]
MSASILLSKLHKVKRTSKNRWLACCPAHQDKRPSLAVRELDDGRVLIHCFTGCNVEEVLHAVGLEFDALFPERAIGDHIPREHRSFNSSDVLAALNFEINVTSIILDRMVNDKDITAGDWLRFKTAADRVRSAKEFVDG